jgi:predicted ArsR family transcriptional regulator
MADKNSSLRRAWLSDDPSELQERLMTALHSADGPLSSTELAKKVGLPTKQVRGYCAWPLSKGYITRVLRKVRGVVGNRNVMRPEIFWSLTSQGIEYLTRRSAQQSVDTPAS